MVTPPTDKALYWNCAGSVVARGYDRANWLNTDVAEGLRSFFTHLASTETDPTVKAFCRRHAHDLDAALTEAAVWNRAFACAA